MGYIKTYPRRQNFAIALAGSTLFHAFLLLQGASSSVIPFARGEVTTFSVQIKPGIFEPTKTPEVVVETETSSNSVSEIPANTPRTAQEIKISQEAEPSEIVFERPPENPGMSTSMVWGGRRYQNEEQVRARTVSDFMQKLQPLTYQINPERCQLQTAADGRTATLQCNTVKDQQQLLSGIGPFLQFTEQLSSIGACFTLIGSQITVTKKCAPF